MSKILSICIPTYNRKKELEELIDSLLQMNNNNFDVVITDNQSTDGTVDMVETKCDSRLKYLCNEKPLAPYLNMIHSIFNSDSKYALYCNDRDLLIPERIEELIHVLEEKEYAFLISPPMSNTNDNSVVEYEPGFESLMGHNLIHHPTGMVFNCEILKDHLSENKYEKYLDCLSIYDFLMMDMFKYGKTAIYKPCYWKQRGPEYLAKNKSGGKLYFSPEARNIMLYGILDFVYLDNDFKLTNKQGIHVLDHIYTEFCYLFTKYKMCMADEFETAHYNIKTEHISTLKMTSIYKGVFENSIKHLEQKNYPQEYIQFLRKRKPKYCFNVLKICAKFDIRSLIKR